MNRQFNEIYWAQVIQKPDWYLEFVPYIEKARKTFGETPEELDEINKTARLFFEKALQQDKVCLANGGPDLDEQRLAVDTIVIHHTSAQPGYRLSYMEATQLLNVYATYYANPTLAEERKFKGAAIWSGHFRDNRQTFLCYHWLMRMNGTFERLLDDSKIGWHAGNWEINHRSIGICLDNDYENKDPDEEILRKLAGHIKKHYPKVNKDNIIGHCEANRSTICPGNGFITIWKPKLLKYIDDES